ncbi:MAG: helix-turn-helix domain-containing protein [Terriglobales bacterium]
MELSDPRENTRRLMQQMEADAGTKLCWIAFDPHNTSRPPTPIPARGVTEIDTGRRTVTAPTALIFARVFGNSPDFWLNVQRRGDLWEAMHSPHQRARIKRARPLTAAASGV